MIFAPRIASIPAVALAAMTLLGPLGAAPPAPPTETTPGVRTSHTAPLAAERIDGPVASPDVVKLTRVVIESLVERLSGVQTPSAEDAVRPLMALALTMNLSPTDVWFVGPQTQTVPVPEVVPVDEPIPSVPPPPPEPEGNPEEGPPPPPGPIRVPEPASVTSALIGASLAGIAWLRRRRKA